MLRTPTPWRTTVRFLLAVARHLGGSGAVHFHTTRIAPLTLAESYTAARLLRGVRVAEAAELPAPDEGAGATPVIGTLEAGTLDTAGTDEDPSVGELREITATLYHEFRSGPAQVRALLDELHRRRTDLEEGVKGYRVVAHSAKKGVPAVVEIEGTVFTAENEREAARTRRLLERSRHHKELRHLLAGNQSAWDAFNAFQHDDSDRNREDTIEMLRAVGKVLLIQGQREEWKLVYLQLRELDEAADAIISVMPRDKYRNNDECVFVFGKHWSRMLRSYAEQERERAAEPA